MKIKFATCCWLLIALGGSATLAQTHPQKKRSHKPVVAQRPMPKPVSIDEVEPYPLLVEDYQRCDLKTVVAKPFDCNKVYAYVEQMPTLNGQPAAAASIAAIEQYLVVPPAAPDGRVFVKFEVSKEGRVGHPEILKGLRADLDSAVLVATRQLPRFTPGKQSGQVVAVSLVLPVTIPARKQP